MNADASREAFLQAMAQTASTVNIVTTAGPGGRHGVTVSAMAPVSAGEPRSILLVCVHHRSPVAAAIAENGVFCVNVLRHDQVHISDCFAGRVKTADGDKFSCARWDDAGGSPRMSDALVALACTVMLIQRVGTHDVVYGTVDALHFGSPGMPLIYAGRAYAAPGPLPGAPVR